MKKLLITIPRMPFPLNSGGRIAIFDALKILSKKYVLTIVIIDDDKNNIKYINELKLFSDNVYFLTKNRFRFLLNSLLGIFAGKPLQVGYFYFKEFQNLINQLSDSHDFFYAFMIRTSLYGQNLRLKKIHYSIDSMYLSYLNSRENTSSLFWKLIYELEVPLLYKFEKKSIKNYDLTTFVSNSEAQFWKPFGNVANLSHGIADEVLNYDKIDDNYKNAISFIGRMDYQPNIDAVLWFCENVLPHIQKKIRFLIVGGFVSDKILNLKKIDSRIEILGFVDDPYVILKSCICVVAPMQSGGGLQTKIMTAMAVGSVVVSTSYSANGIENARSGVNLVIEDNPIQMANLINEIKLNPSKFNNIRLKAKQLISDEYTLSVIESKLFSLIEKQIN